MTDAPAESKSGEFSSKQVRFDASVKTQSTKKRLVKRVGPEEGESTKVHMGKFNPLRDLAIAVGAIGFMAIVGRDFDPASFRKGASKPKSPALVALESFKDSFAKTFEERRREETCDLFLETSSIPGSGLSIFAGRNYSAGELLMDSPMLFPWSLTETDDSAFLPAYAFLLKHRPNMTNVEGTLVTANEYAQLELRATTEIKEGDELFVPFDMHPKASLPAHSSLFQYIPTMKTYEEVRAILEDMQSSFRKLLSGKKANRKVLDSNFGVNMVKRSVTKVDYSVGSLLPNSKGDFEAQRKRYPMWAKSNKRSLDALQANGKCLCDVKQEEDATIVATKSFKKGEVVVPAPLHVMEYDRSCSTSKEKECRVPKNTALCFGHQDSNLVFCPLTLSALIPQESDGDINVEYRWTSDTMKKLTVEDALTVPGGLSWDVVATKDIASGGKVCASHRIVLFESLQLFLIPLSLLY